ncbi:MAG: hypothetical protein ABSG55_10465 [Dehalococcoidia bacterium]|jgi:hypothetical protein
MKLLRLLPLLLLPALFLGDTCVNTVEQKAPGGPWVGEVTNNGPNPMNHLQVQGQILDSNGQVVSYSSVQACPLLLRPGEKGAYEMSFPADPNALSLPLHALLSPQVQGDPTLGWDTSSDGLIARIVEKDAARRYVLAEVTNQSPQTYWNLTICAIGRTSAGAVAAVTSVDLFPNLLRSGDKTRVAIFFSTMPDTVDLFPSGTQTCCVSDLSFDPALFRVTATKIVNAPQGRELDVVGEMDNQTGQDLSNVRLQAYEQREPAYPVQASVGCGDGTIVRGARGQAAFAIPLQPGDNGTSVVIAGIQASPGSNVAVVPVSSPTLTQQGEDFVVSATLSNPTNRWLNIRGVCYNLRDSSGTLVGTLSGGSENPMMPPGITRAVSAVVSPLGKPDAAEVIAYADVLDQPPPTSGPVY